MAAQPLSTDYSLTGERSRQAIARGLAHIAGAKWYASPIPRKRMKELMARSDGPALRDTALWFGLILIFGALGIVAGFLRQRRVVPWRGGIRRWAPLSAGILLLVFLGFGGENTDVGAHVAGFALGGLLGLALGRWGRQLPQGWRAQWLYGLAALGLVAGAWLLALRSGQLAHAY